MLAEMDWMRTLASDHTFVFFFVVVGIPTITWGSVEVVRILIRHRERMAMIEQGMNPDALSSKPVKE